MPLQPVGINERLMKLRIPLSRIRHLTIISAYTPTLTSPDDDKEQFYEQFDQIIRSTPPSDKLVILGDFNARVGRDFSSWEGVLGRHGVGKINDNGLLLPSKWAEHSLWITNTLFRMADKYKTLGCTRGRNTGTWYTSSSSANETSETSVWPVPWEALSAGLTTDWCTLHRPTETNPRLSGPPTMSPGWRTHPTVHDSSKC